MVMHCKRRIIMYINIYIYKSPIGDNYYEKIIVKEK